LEVNHKGHGAQQRRRRVPDIYRKTGMPAKRRLDSGSSH
jgi:hypothetical protein